MKILLAVDGSEYSVKAAKFLAAHFDWFQGMPDLHVLHVKRPIPKGMALVEAESILGREQINRYYREEAEAAVRPAASVLQEHHVPFQWTYKVGDIARCICAYATENGIDLIVMGSHGNGALKNLMMGSVATKVLAASHEAPVLIVR